MNSKPGKDNQEATDAIQHFLKKVGVRSSKSADHTALSSLMQEVFGKANRSSALHLQKIRKYWVDLVDPFLAQRAYPRNLSVQKARKLTHQQFLASAKKNIDNTSLYPVLEKYVEQSFDSIYQAYKVIEHQLQRSLSDQERRELAQRFDTVSIKHILHLNVYDGGMSMAIRLKLQKYIDLINQCIPEFPVDDIECHIVELKQVQQDRYLVSQWREKWRQLVGKDIAAKCKPLFLYRLPEHIGVLVCELLQDLNDDFYDVKEQILLQLYCHSPELQKQVHRIKWVSSQKSIGLQIVSKGNISEQEQPELEETAELESISAESSYSNSSVKVQLYDIIKRMKQNLG